MRRTIRAALVLAIGSTLAGCVTTSEMPLAKNVWQVSTETQGALFTGQAGKATMKRAAEPNARSSSASRPSSVRSDAWAAAKNSWKGAWRKP